jgi:hypothetical protein
MYTDLDTSDWRLWVMCVIIVGCLALWLGAVFRAARRPGSADARTVDTEAPGQVLTYDRQAPEPYPSIPRPAPHRDSSVPLPAQRTGSATENPQPISEKTLS